MSTAPAHANPLPIPEPTRQNGQDVPPDDAVSADILILTARRRPITITDPQHWLDLCA
jgi:hypothetical protein